MALSITYDKHGLIINGKREFILGGSIHYYRLPSHKLWKKRISLVKEAGLNAIDIYFPWNYHSQADGIYDFSGIRDVDYLLNLIEDAGLYLIARPGPYICSEVDAGGFPAWLLNKKNVVLRCRENGKYKYSKEYMNYVKQWWEQIVPKIAKKGNLILFQIENEYSLIPFTSGFIGAILRFLREKNPLIPLRIGSNPIFKIINQKLFFTASKYQKIEVKCEYLSELYRMSRELGIKVPIFHNDITVFTGRMEDVDIMGYDDYAICDFRNDWRKNKNTFCSLDVLEKAYSLLRKETPIFIPEFQGGWFDMWGGYGYDKIREVLGHEQIEIATKTALSQGTTMINYFMFSGGTTWGYLGSPDVYTSYDFAAPITETGLKSKRFYVIKWLAEIIKHLGEDFMLSEPEIDPMKKYKINIPHSSVHVIVRKGKECLYFFIRNLSDKHKPITLNILGKKISVRHTSMKILVFDKNNRLINQFGSFSSSSYMLKNDILNSPKNEEKMNINNNENGESHEIKLLSKPQKLQPPELKFWYRSFVSPQIYVDYDDSNWKRVLNSEKMDIDTCEIHYGYIWYRGKYRGILDKVEIDARHLYSVYVNGRLINSFDNFTNVTGAGEDLSKINVFSIPAYLQKDDDYNYIVILVCSLGHNKNFEDDARNPRGIVSINTFGVEIDWKVRGGLIEGESGICPIVDFSKIKTLCSLTLKAKEDNNISAGENNDARGEKVKVKSKDHLYNSAGTSEVRDKATRIWSIEGKESVVLPHSWGKNDEGVFLYETEFELSEEFKDLAVKVEIETGHSIANIYLNGYLIGRYWRKKGPQKKFYLPEGILKIGEKNHLAVAFWKRGSVGKVGKIYLSI